MIAFQKSTMLALLAALPVAVAKTSASLHERIMAERNNPCRLYLAPSSLSTESSPRFGMFTGVDLKLNETLENPEIAIPLVDLLEGPYNFIPEYQDIMQYLESYLWTADHAGARFEGNYSSTVLVPGAGSLAHYHTGHYNLDWVHSAALFREREAITETGKPHPSRGAITNYYNMTMRATMDIKAGMELFANFGDVWDEAKVDMYEQTITRWDYADADKIVDKIFEFMDKFGDSMSDTLQEDTIEFITNNILGGAGGKRAKGIRSLIPTSMRKLKQLKELGGSFNYRNQDMVKSITWLKKNGVCVDNLRSGPSTIPGAGRGAFAKRDIHQGDRISISPMLFLPTDEVLNMYMINKVTEKNEEGEEPFYLEFDYEKPIGQQLLLNYAMGHVQSSMALIPTAPMVNLINHAPGDKANCYVDWSDHEKLFNDNELHGMSIEEIRELDAPAFMIQYIALRDIAEGEEITFDYGEDFEAALQEYLVEYKATTESLDWPAKAEDMRLVFKDKPYPFDVRSGTYPKGVMTACFVELASMPDGRPKTNEAGEEINLWEGPKALDEFEGHKMVVCDVVGRRDDPDEKFIYTVKLRPKGMTEIVQVEDVPHRAITIVDKAYSSDTFTPNAFRRWISIRDERFPLKWRNIE